MYGLRDVTASDVTDPDGALSQGRECLPDSKALPFSPLLSRRLHLWPAVVIGTPYRAEHADVCSVEGQI
ncbi:hypothetical protein HDV63DRAFT_211657 [Trichoderma sp. SZMC 28014]